MLPIIGIVVVFGAVIAGFMMEKGHLLVLVQPSELVTIVGAAIGTLLVANPIHIIKAMLAGVLGVLSPSRFSKRRYLDTLKMMFELCNKVRKKGLIGIEDDVEKPADSEIFKKYPEFLKDHHVGAFVCDTLRTAITGGVEPFDMDQMMELDMEVAHHEALLPVNSLTTVADALPGLGIVAAVFGVVITMGSLGGPPEEIGKKVAAALVGTFLGILLCYGLVGPLASNMGKEADQQNSYLHVIRVIILGWLQCWPSRWEGAQYPKMYGPPSTRWRTDANAPQGVKCHRPVPARKFSPQSLPQCKETDHGSRP
jgi:chemotaxis protein MotA